MRRRIAFPITALLCLSLLPAARAPMDQLALATDSKLWFDGKSTVRDWSCKAEKMNVTIESEPNAIQAVLGGDKAVKTVKLDILAAALECGNGTMNGHMRKALNAEKQPTISFALSTYDLAPGKGVLKGTLTINGVPKPIVLPVVFTEGPAATLRVKGSYPLTMTEWNVTPPKLMMGTLKVDPLVTIGFDLLLKA